MLILNSQLGAGQSQTAPRQSRSDDCKPCGFKPAGIRWMTAGVA